MSKQNIMKKLALYREDIVSQKKIIHPRDTTNHEILR